jgi:5-methylcytosine-specific restriction endonuclease McrA
MTMLPFAKPIPIRQQKVLRRAQERAWIEQVRREVFRLDPVCVVCDVPSPSDELHEVVPRSRTRGQPPDQRFSRQLCVRLCRICHRDVTEHRVELAFYDMALGVDGGLLIQDRCWIGNVAKVYHRGRKARGLLRDVWVGRGRWEQV